MRAVCLGSPLKRPLLLFGLLVPACQPATAPGPVVWDPFSGHSYAVQTGSLSLDRTHAVSKHFGLPDEGKHAATRAVLGDTRDALVGAIPHLFQVPLQQEGNFRLSFAVHRPPSSDAGEIHVEVFLNQDTQLQSLVSADLPAPTPDSPFWIPLSAEWEAQASTQLQFVARWSDSSRAYATGPEISWGQPCITHVAPQSQTDSPSQASANPSQPDVLLLTVDTLRSDGLNSAPQLASLLQEGALFPQAVASSSWTLPAYASLMTGLDPEFHGAGRGSFPATPGSHGEKDYRAMNAHLPTLAEAFAKAGYATAMVHQHPFLEPWTGVDRGFQRYQRVSADSQAVFAAADQFWTDEPHRPRFLVLHLMAPHLPYADTSIPKDWAVFFAQDSTAEERRTFFDFPEARRKEIRQDYARGVAAMDAELGPWLTQVLHQASPPLFGFHVDHGEELWEEDGFEHGHAFPDSVARVPVAVVWPGKVSAQVSSQAVGAAWLGATLQRLAGLPDPQQPGLLQPATESRCVGTLYRTNTGGRIFSLQDNSSQTLPLTQAIFATGPSSALPPALQKALTALGYAGD